MQIRGWKYYNHAAKPLCAPHEDPDLSPIQDGSIWKMDGRPLFAKWTTEFDCGYETEWWYCIKDEPFDIASLKAKRRYEINKGNKNFIVHSVDPVGVIDEMYRVYQQAMNSYPEKYRSMLSKDAYLSNMRVIEDLKKDSKYEVFVAVSNDASIIEGYCLLPITEQYASLAVQKVNPDCEKLGINAALVNGVLTHFADQLAHGFYICDGERNVVHETAFQEYLIKYFGFRKAYCKLNLSYSMPMSLAVKCLYPFRYLLEKMDNNKAIHQINGVLKLEEYTRMGGVILILQVTNEYYIANKNKVLLAA